MCILELGRPLRVPGAPSTAEMPRKHGPPAPQSRILFPRSASPSGSLALMRLGNATTGVAFLCGMMWSIGSPQQPYGHRFRDPRSSSQWNRVPPGNWGSVTCWARRVKHPEAWRASESLAKPCCVALLTPSPPLQKPGEGAIDFKQDVSTTRGAKLQPSKHVQPAGAA